ncbi:MAG: elongation factor P hydroxylase [Rhodospirillaceae bacterium]|nr:elongation factor P hydroxylase [Rhodospirillaceae bacterium]
MILTPIAPEALPGILKAFEQGLGDDVFARAVFQRIAATLQYAPDLKADLHAGRQKAIDLAVRKGIPVCDEDPAVAFSWDGHVIRTRSETSVVFHEIAHWQIAPTERRALYDFGLGAGPESGRIDDANKVVCVDNATKEEEENLSSLLGILWEVEHDEPAILAFAEQNWLELPDSAYTPRHFARCLNDLRTRGVLPSSFADQAAALGLLAQAA